MNFHEVQFPTNLSFGSVGGPERRTEIVTLSNGHEERNSPWAHSRRRFDAGLGMRSLDDLEVLIAFFEARNGQLFGFRWKDWTDFKSCVPSDEVHETDQVLAIGDGETTEFQLSKTYRSGEYTYQRPVTKPVDGTVRVAISGDIKTEGAEYTIDHATGLISFVSPPPQDAQVEAGFEFDVPVRFETDRIETSVAGFSVGEAPSVPVVEIRV
ncbi:phage distal tail protein, Rcc01695 family [Halovulum sp. GXIMD14793]